MQNVRVFVQLSRLRKQRIIRNIIKVSTTARRCLHGAVALLFALTGCDVRAQVNASVSVVSDYRFRGVSLSDGHPELQLNLTYDSPAGWYAGAFASGMQWRDGGRDTQVVAYGGYARRLPSGLSWEAGALDSVYLQTAQLNYAETFVGLSYDKVGGRIYFSPRYLGQDIRTVYAELNGSYQVRDWLHVLGHVGFLRPLSQPVAYTAEIPSRYDVRIGTSANLADWTVQLAWVATAKSRQNDPLYGDRVPHKFVLSTSYSF